MVAYESNYSEKFNSTCSRKPEIVIGINTRPFELTESSKYWELNYCKAPKAKQEKFAFGSS